MWKKPLTISVKSTDLIKKLDRLTYKKSLWKALDEVGATVEEYAKVNLVNNHSNKTGRLMNSITHMINPDEDSVEIGTNVHYAPYVEFGTGVGFVGDGPHRKGYWVYVKGESASNDPVHKDYTGVVYDLNKAKQIKAWLINEKGCNPDDVVITEGSQAKPFLEPALLDNIEEIKQIFNDALHEEVK